MDTLLLLARLVPAVVFATAAVTKLADLDGSRQAMRDFGLPARLAPIAGATLPLLELLVAIALVLPTTARWGALATLVLLATFTGAIVRALWRGEQPECHCFGQVHSAPAGRTALARNLGLAALAGVVVTAGAGASGAGAITWIARLDATQAVGLGVAAALAVAVAVLGRLEVVLIAQNGRLLERLERLEQGTGARSAPPTDGLPVGAAAPLFDLPSAVGGRMSLDVLQAHGRPVLLVFSDPRCGACRALAPDLAAWHRDHANRVTLALLTRGETLEADPDGGPVSLIRAGALASAYGVSATPSAVLIGTDGRVASRLATGASGVRTLLAQSLEEPARTPVRLPGAASRPPGPRVGQHAPAFSLPDLDGRSVDVRDLRGQATLLLFWNPACGFCQRMLDDVRDLAVEARPEAPRLVVVSTGDVGANRTDDLPAPVLLDGPGRPVMHAFGVPATPAAVLLDAAGAIGSSAVVGADAVLSLAAGAGAEVVAL